MKATLIKSLSNKKEAVEVQAGKTIADNFPDIDFNNAIALVNGAKADKGRVLREGDAVTVRVLPSDGFSASDWVLTAFTGGIYGIIKVGVDSYKAMEEAQRELEKMKKLSNNDSLDNRPFLRGASNTVAKGKSQPYVCGRHLFTPYLLCNPFYEITGEDGADEYTYIALECGFCPQVVQKIAIEDIMIKTFADTFPQGASGTAQAYDIDGGNVFASGGKVEIAQSGAEFSELSALNCKVVSATCNGEIIKDKAVEKDGKERTVYTLDPNAMDVDIAITFPYGLYKYNDDNDKVKASVTITPEYSLDGGSSWTAFTFMQNGTESNKFERNVSTKEIRFVAHKDFSVSDYTTLKNNSKSAIVIRCRSDGKYGDAKVKDDCYVLYYQSRCFDPLKSAVPAGVDGGSSGLVPCKIVEDRERAFCTMLGVKLKASASNEDKLKKINIITHGMARTWNGSSWSENKSLTRNPAAWALEILTSDSHPLSKFADSEIDLESFGELYEWCDLNNYKFDHVITQNRKKGDTLNSIMDVCGAALYWDMYGRLAVAIDTPQENAIAVYNPQNIISIKNKRKFGRRTDGLRIKYVTDYDDLYTEETYLLMRDGVTFDANSTIRDISVTGITTYEHVVKYARRLMAIEALRPKTTAIEVGCEGTYFTPYSKILLQDDSLKIGISSAVIKSVSWKSGLLKTVALDNPVEFPAGKACGVIVNCFSSGRAVPVPLKVRGSGRTDTLEVETSLASSADAVPEAGCVLSFGELDVNGRFSKITTPYLISGINRSGNGFSLELVNYFEAIYDEGIIPDYKSNITQKRPSATQAIPPNWITKDDVFDEIADAANEVIELVMSGVNYSTVFDIGTVGTLDDVGKAGTLGTIGKVSGVNRANAVNLLNVESIFKKIDEVNERASEGIQITEEGLVIQIEDAERGLVSTIQQTADRITAQVEDLNEQQSAALQLKADEILGVVQSEKEGLLSVIQQTAEGFSTLVENTKENLQTIIQQTADGITADVIKNKDEISQIKQTATEITQIVQNNKEEAERKISQVIQTAERLLVLIDDDAKKASAALSVTADEIILQVEKTEEALRSTIDIRSDEILIQVDKDIKDEREARIAAINVALERIIAMVDDSKLQSQAGIQITAEQILLEVKDKENGLRAAIDMTARRILAQVEDEKNHIMSSIEETAERIIAKVDNDRDDAHAGLEIWSDEILLQVKTKNEELISSIDIKVNEIIAEVVNNIDSLSGTLDVQAGAVQALVTGGGASGKMALSVELPALVDGALLDGSNESGWIQKAQAKNVTITPEELAAVYVRVAGTDYYSIRSDVDGDVIKALWNKLRQADLLASQIVLDAKQIFMSGTTVFSTITTAQSDASSALTAASNAATAASNAQSTADTASTNASTALSTANTASTNASTALSTANTAKTSVDNINNNWDSLVANAKVNGQTIIQGGYIRSNLIDVDNLIAQNVKSKEYAHGSSGFYLDGATGSAHFEGTTHIGGNLTVSGSGEIGENVVIKGFIGQGVKFKVLGYIYFYNDGTNQTKTSAIVNNINLSSYIELKSNETMLSITLPSSLFPGYTLTSSMCVISDFESLEFYRAENNNQMFILVPYIQTAINGAGTKYPGISFLIRGVFPSQSSTFQKIRRVKAIIFYFSF